MPRTIEYGAHELVVRLTGWVRQESLTEELRIPYSTIAEVTTAPFVAPPGTVRDFGVSVPFTDIREGRFRHQGEWYFLSFEHRERAVTLRLRGYHHGDRAEPLTAVVIGSEEPERLRAEIEAHRSAAVPPPP